MKLILLKDVKKIGKKDDIVDVAEGYARNHLIPDKLAIEANKKNINDLNSKKDSQRKRNLATIEKATGLSVNLRKEELTFYVKENEGKIFGSITSKLIAERLNNLGYPIDKKSIDLDRPINNLGETKVKIKLHSDVHAEISVITLKEEN